MVRIFAVGVLVMSGLLSIVSTASAEDGGQYYMGGKNITSEPAPSTLQR